MTLVWTFQNYMVILVAEKNNGTKILGKVSAAASVSVKASKVAGIGEASEVSDIGVGIEKMLSIRIAIGEYFGVGPALAKTSKT